MLIKLDNDVRIDFITQPGRVGIGEVFIGDRLLRNGAELIQPQFATMEGMELDRLEYMDHDEKDGVYTIRTIPFFRVAHRMEWAEHGSHLRVSTNSWSNGAYQPEGAIIKWTIKASSDILYDVEYKGFSYSFTYMVPDYPIYQIQDKATWELDGEASGHTFIMRGAWGKPVIKLDNDTEFNTYRYYEAIANPYIFQHVPLYSQLQGFTFQYKNDAILVTSHEKPSHVRSYYEKRSSSPLLLHFNQFCFDMTENHTTPARKILYTELGACTDETTINNHFLRVRDVLQARIREYYDLKNDLTRPTCALETWEIAKIENFGPAFDRINEWGLKRCMLMPLWRSNETDIVPRFNEDKERFGILGNMCCPIELEIADCYGGWDGMKQVMERAVEHGIETYMWFGSHFSSSSNLADRIKGLFAHDVNGQNNRNNYGHVLWAVDQNNTEFEEYLINAYRKLGEYGMKGIFRDSHFNMASDTITYNRNPDGTGNARSMHDTEARIQSRFQNELDMLYYVESDGVTGTPRVGTDYDHVRGMEWIYSNVNTGMELDKLEKYGDDPLWVYFKSMSCRLIYHVWIEINEFPAKSSILPWWNEETFPPYVRAYFEAEPYMDQMWLLENENGILWSCNEGRVVFAWENFDFMIDPEESVYEPLTGKNINPSNSMYKMEKMGIYILTKRGK